MSVDDSEAARIAEPDTIRLQLRGVEPTFEPLNRAELLMQNSYLQGQILEHRATLRAVRKLLDLRDTAGEGGVDPAMILDAISGVIGPDPARETRDAMARPMERLHPGRPV